MRHQQAQQDQQVLRRIDGSNRQYRSNWGSLDGHRTDRTDWKHRPHRSPIDSDRTDRTNGTDWQHRSHGAPIDGYRSNRKHGSPTGPTGMTGPTGPPGTDSIQTVTVANTPYTILPTNDYLYVDTSGGPITMILPDPTQFGFAKQYFIVDSTAASTPII